MQQVALPNSRSILAAVDPPMSAEGRRFGANLKRFRLIAGLSIRDLARRAGVSFGLLAKYERGVIHSPRPDIVVKLARELNVTVADLLGIEGPPPAAPLYPVDARVLRFLGPVGANPRRGAERLAASSAADQFDLVAIGDCLAPEVQDGDTLRLDVDAQPATGRIVAVAVHGELYLKKVLQRTTGNLFLWSKRGELVTPEEGVEVLGVVVQISRPVVQVRYDIGNPGRQVATRPDQNVAG